MDYRSRLYQNNLPTKIISSKDKINHLYIQIHPEITSSNMKSSYGIPCSDQKLLLYGVQARVFNHTPNPTDMPSKLKEAKRNLLNNTIDYPNSFSNKRKLSQFPKTFQEKYCELAKYTGNEIAIPQCPRSSYTPSKIMSRPRVKQPETKAEKMKQEILSSFTQQDSNNDFYNLNKFKDSFSFKQNGISTHIIHLYLDKRGSKGRSNIFAWL